MAQHILLVDDDALLRRSLAYNLERAGYHTTTAVSYTHLTLPTSDLV